MTFQKFKEAGRCRIILEKKYPNWFWFDASAKEGTAYGY